MNTDGFFGVISDGELNGHIAYLDRLRNEHSVEVKCDARLCGVDYFSFISSRALRRAGRDIGARLLEIYLHEVYFNSFTTNPRPSELVRRFWNTENEFVYRGFLLASDMKCGFLVAYKDARGAPTWGWIGDFDTRITARPLLCIDLSRYAKALVRARHDTVYTSQR